MPEGRFEVRSGSVGIVGGKTDVRPTLFIGLGGSGLKVLARLRRRIYEQYGDADHWRIFAFLGIDTNKNDIGLKGVENQQGYPIDGNDLHWIGMTDDRVSAYLDELNGNAYFVSHWISQGIHRFARTNFVDGAVQVRAIGRMLFVSQIREIARWIRERVERIGGDESIRSVDHVDRAVDVVIVASVAGGTGAGAFLDCAYLVRALRSRTAVPLGRVRGLLMLPDVFRDVVRDPTEQDITDANGYAALRELEYFNGRGGQTFDPADWGLDWPVLNRETPFDICYLFSRSNGEVQEEKPDGIYNLVADALYFAAGQTPLAGAIRGSWNNAQAKLANAVAYCIDAAHYEEGGPAEGDRPLAERTMLLFDRQWSTRFSSLGISSITMKIRELRRIAAVRLLRRIILWEIGAPPDRAALQVEVKPLVETFLNLKTLVEAQRRATSVQAKQVRQSTSGQEAEERYRACLAVLEEAIDYVSRPPEASDEKLVETGPGADLLRNARSAAEATFRAILNQISSTKNLHHSLAVLEGMLQMLAQGEARVAIPARGLTRSKALDQWLDLDSAHGLDLLALRDKALEIIRDEVDTHLREDCSSLVKELYLYLRRAYLARACELIRQEIERLNGGIHLLQAVDLEVRTMQEKLVEQFDELRHEVLTKYLAASPGEEEKQKLLDAEINRALKRPMDASRQDQSYETIRHEILRRYNVAGAVHASCLELVAGNQRNINVATILSNLVDIIARDILVDLPENRDVFEHYRRINKPDDLLADAERAMNRAKAYWPLDERFRDGETSYKADLLASTVEYPGPDVLRDQLKARVDTQRPPWKYVPGSSGEGTEEGELVFVTESHGYGLPSLRQLAEMREKYEKISRQGMLDDRHLDIRLIDKLPDISSIDNKQARDEVASWDRAMLGIVLGIFRWNEGRQLYQYTQERRFYYPGTTYLEVAEWLRGRDGMQVLPVLDRQVNAWFTALIRGVTGGSPEEQKASARSQAEILVTADLALDLMGQHVFPEIVSRGGKHHQQTPAHTMIQRLRRGLVGRHLEHFEDRRMWGIDIGTLRREVEPKLHRGIRFVGPKPPEGYNERVWDKRILQLMAKPDEREAKAVLEEAHRWFPDIPETVALTSVFPHDADERFVDKPQVPTNPYQQQDDASESGPADGPEP